MKNCVVCILLFHALLYGYKVKAQSHEAQQLLLNVEKLAQLKNILEDLKKGYEIVFVGYSTIKSISEGNFNLHNAFLDGLFEVSPLVKNYVRIPAIIQAQVQLVKEYKMANIHFKNSGLFSKEELAYLGKVYSRLANESLKNLDALTAVLTARKLRMSDDERINSIDAIWKGMEDRLIFLRQFNNQLKVLAIQRSREKNAVITAKELYNLKK